jgi:gas vesicle protein
MRTIRAFIWGSAIGAAVGLLFAPQRGDVTRAQLQERINQWQNQAQSQMGTLSGKATSAIETGRQQINTRLSQAQSATNAAADKAQQQVSSASNQ